MGSSMLLLGEDGKGYELARSLEAAGAWRSWLGDDSTYSAFVPSLSSPAAWDAFMFPQSQAQAQIHLQLRVRALLFDKASISLFISSFPPPPPLSNLNPHYLQLHGDDVFFSLEQHRPDHHHHHQAQSRSGGKGNETWYTQYFDKIQARHHTFPPHGDKEALKRTSEGMSAYLQLREMHKRKRQAFKGDLQAGINGSRSQKISLTPPKMAADVNGSTEEDIAFFPEIMFPSNCVPDTCLPLKNDMDKKQTAEFNGILDDLPIVVSRSTAMMERFGIRPDYIRVGTKYRGIDGSGREKKPLCQEQASLMTQKIVARLLANAGFDGGHGTSMEVFSEVIGSHICKLGRILKLLTDSYKRQFSPIELLQMFLQTAGYNNLGALIESTKDCNKGIVTQTSQNARAVQSQHQNSILQAQHLQRQMHPQSQMNMLHPQNLTPQQQQQFEKLRAATPRGSVMMTDKEQQQQPMVDVKVENMMESSPAIDSSTFNSLSKQQTMQMQLRQQQQLQQHQQQQHMGMANHHAAQSAQQFRQLQSAQIPQLPLQNAYGMRPAAIKIEAFHELMGGDSTLKHEPDHNKLTSPSK